MGESVEQINLTKQLDIVHLSDLHFGPDHRFNPPPTAMGDTPSRKGFPTLLEKLVDSLADPTSIRNLIVCITGDLTTDATFPEYKAAEEFIRELGQTPIHGARRGLGSIYTVPGNHDVKFDSADPAERWERYVSFVNRLQGSHLDHSTPIRTVQLHDRTPDQGALVLCLNSAIHVQRDTPSERRGEVDYEQLGEVENLLKAVPADHMREGIKIALVHHHPVLIPALVESDRGYDAVENAGLLLNLLRSHGFHLILHGHKHNPFVFTEDSTSAWAKSSQPIVIAAGGSVGSKKLPSRFARPSNCYNRITVKWHPAARQTRIKVQTLGLTVFDSSGHESHPKNWRWEVLKDEDRFFLGGPCRPDSKAVELEVFEGQRMADRERERTGEYTRTRGNLPVVEVMPSLVPEQAYESRVWIVGHKRTELPLEVTWSAGPKFPVARVRRDQDPRFCAAFHYWGPMLIQAVLRFSDGQDEAVHVYARIPEEYGGG